MKIIGPMHSISASGKFGGFVFEKNGRGREWVRPWNPQTTPQMDNRQDFAVSAKGIQIIGPDTVILIKASELMIGNPASEWGAWTNGAIGRQIENGAYTIYDAMSAPEQLTWTDAAIALGMQGVALPNTTVPVVDSGPTLFSVAMACYGTEISIYFFLGAPGGANAVAWAAAVAS